MIFKERLRELRKSKCMTQKQIAKILHCSNTTISNYESGNNEPSFSILILLSDYFNVSVDYLLGRETNK